MLASNQRGARGASALPGRGGEGATADSAVFAEEMIQAITRVILITGGLLGGFAVTRLVDWQNELGLPRYYVIFLFIILGGALGFVLGGILGRELSRAWDRVENRIRETAPADVLLATIGLVVGLFVAFLASQPLRFIRPEWLAVSGAILLTASLAYVGVRVALSKRRDFAAMYPTLAPAELVTANNRVLLLDTSAVIDGRFLELHRTGFLPGSMRVPRFVLAELQTLADSSDDVRRARGRRGLDLLASLPDSERLSVFETDYADTPLVDEKLMRLGVASSSAIVTVDFNLTKVARVRGIEALNLNDAAVALRPNYLPGETIALRISKNGKEPDQGVGFLEDGTMVVVQSGRALVGTDAHVEVTSVLQTSAGRMVFACPAEHETASETDGA